MAEDHGRNVAVIQMLIRLVIKQAFRETATRGNCYRCQFHCPRVIAHRVDTFNVGILIFIDDDIPFFVSFNASGFQVDVVIGRLATNRPNQAIHRFTAAIFQLQRQATISIFHYCFRDGVGVQLRAFSVHHFDQRFRDHRVKAAQRRMFTHKQMRFRAEAVNHARQFHGDVTRANNRHALWQSRKGEEAIRINTVFHARNIRVARTTAGGDQNMIGRDGFTVNFQRFGINEAGKAFDYINVIFTEHVFIGGMNTVDIGGTAGDQRFPVELVDGGIETIIRAVHMDRFTDLRRVPHHFFRHTANIYAGAAQFFGFNQRAFLTVHSRAVDGGDTAAAAADGDVIIVFSHDRVSLSLITAIVARDVIGASDGCNYSGTIQLTVA